MQTMEVLFSICADSMPACAVVKIGSNLSLQEAKEGDTVPAPVRVHDARGRGATLF